MNKAYLNGIIILTVALIVVAVFATTNHFVGYYDPNGTIAKKNNKSNNNNNKPKPTPTPDPTPTPAPDGKEIYGYKCQYANCDVLTGTQLINSKYVFIVDGENNVVLFDSVNKETVSTYKSVAVTGKYYTIKNQNDKYGVISVFENVKEITPAEYTIIEYIPAKSNYIFTKDKASFVTDNDCQVITLTYNAQIIDYNELYIITKTTAGQYHIFNYNNRTELTEYVNSKRVYIELVKSYVGVVTDDYKYQLYDFRNGSKLITEYQLSKNAKSFHGVITNANRLEIYADDNLVQTIDL